MELVVGECPDGEGPNGIAGSRWGGPDLELLVEGPVGEGPNGIASRGGSRWNC